MSKWGPRPGLLKRGIEFQAPKGFQELRMPPLGLQLIRMCCGNIQIFRLTIRAECLPIKFPKQVFRSSNPLHDKKINFRNILSDIVQLFFYRTSSGQNKLYEVQTLGNNNGYYCSGHVTCYMIVNQSWKHFLSPVIFVRGWQFLIGWHTYPAYRNFCPSQRLHDTTAAEEVSIGIGIGNRN